MLPLTIRAQAHHHPIGLRLHAWCGFADARAQPRCALCRPCTDRLGSWCISHHGAHLHCRVFSGGDSRSTRRHDGSLATDRTHLRLCTTTCFAPTCQKSDPHAFSFVSHHWTTFFFFCFPANKSVARVPRKFYCRRWAGWSWAGCRKGSSWLFRQSAVKKRVGRGFRGGLILETEVLLSLERVVELILVCSW